MSSSYTIEGNTLCIHDFEDRVVYPIIISLSTLVLHNAFNYRKTCPAFLAGQVFFLSYSHAGNIWLLFFKRTKPQDRFVNIHRSGSDIKHGQTELYHSIVDQPKFLR